jgi:hypothetical protein
MAFFYKPKCREDIAVEMESLVSKRVNSCHDNCSWNSSMFHGAFVEARYHGFHGKW